MENMEMGKTLTIIGNGFDLLHGLKTTYADFHRFMVEKNETYARCASLLEAFYHLDDEDGDQMLWADLERALGYIDPVATYDKCNEGMEVSEKELPMILAIFEDKPAMTLKKCLSLLHHAFGEWLSQIDLSQTSQVGYIPHFDKESTFLNFNYTETLEKVYDVCRHQITYIHGRRNSDDEIVLGHCHPQDGGEFFSTDNKFYRDNAYYSIVDVSNKEMKNVEEVMLRHDDFFCKIRQDIRMCGKGEKHRIVVLGHSYSEVDFPYFARIRNIVEEEMGEVAWFMGYHTKRDKVLAEEYVERLRLGKNHRLFEYGRS